MTRTAWRLRDLPATALAMPYSAERTPYGHYTFPDYPDGGLRTSVDDLSKFLRAVANGGALGGARILQPASVAEMLRVQYPAVPRAGKFFDKDATQPPPSFLRTRESSLWGRSLGPRVRGEDVE